MPRWVYFSSKTGTTERLMHSAGLDALRLPLAADAPIPHVHGPFLLVTPSFGDGQGKGDVPKAVIRFLNHPDNRQWIRGVVGCGDRNFGATFARAATVIAGKCQVPLLHRVERAGTALDWQRLRDIDAQFAAHLHRTHPLSCHDALQ